MPSSYQMDINERRKYLSIMRRRYERADRKERGGLLDEMVTVTGLHRKSVLRLLHGELSRRPRAKQRGRVYGAQVDDALRVIAESSDYLCAERLTPNLVWMATQLALHEEIHPSPELLRQLGEISVPTVRRILQRIGRDQPRLPRKGPHNANRATREIPMRRIAWNEQQPGHFETDLVHHCGATASGQYVHTLQMVDVATGWSERVAILGRGYLAMEDGFRRILAHLPFPVLEIHPDNGSEFFNDHLLRFWGEMTVHGVQLSRSRPFHKNDNRFVEQKNDTLVRAYLGHERLDTVAQTRAANTLYDKMWLYYNFFQPVMRLTEKLVDSDPDHAFRVKRKFDQARTPFDRLCATAVITQQQQEQLETLRDRTNPRQLRAEIYALIDEIFSLPSALSGLTENVLDTLTSIPV